MIDDLLFDVPTNPTRIEQFKARHQIETQHCEGQGETSWLALHLPSARTWGKQYGLTDKSDLFDCLAAVGRLLEEAGEVGWGATEADAIMELCKGVKIPVLPNDL